MSKSMHDHQLQTEFHYTTFVLACDEEEKRDDLGIENVGGVFVVLAGGCVVALIIASMDFLWNVEKIAIEEKAINLRPLLRNNFPLSTLFRSKFQISPWDAFKSEICFAFNVWIITKPVRAKSSEIVEAVSRGSRKSTPPRSLKSRSRYGSESRSLKNKSTRSLNFDHDSNSRSLLNLH